MDGSNGKESDFINAVWRKVRVLEYVKAEQEQVMENRRRLIRKKLKIGALLLFITTVCIVSVIGISGFDFGTLCLAGFLVLAAGVVFEALPDFELKGRLRNAHKNRKLV